MGTSPWGRTPSPARTALLTPSIGSGSLPSMTCRTSGSRRRDGSGPCLATATSRPKSDVGAPAGTESLSMAPSGNRPAVRRMSVRQAQAVEAALLAGIFVVAAFLRFDQVWHRGLLYWDEGKFALEGVRMLAYMQSWFGTHLVSYAGKTVGTAKPTHALLIGLSYVIFGVHDYASVYVEGFCSVLEIGCLYVLARKLFGPSVALIAALFLAVSEYDVIYARSALSESDADLLFLVGATIWALSWTRWEGAEGSRAGPSGWLILVSGIVLGLALTVNYRLSVYIGVLVVTDVVMVLRRQGWKRGVRHLLLWVGGVLAFPVLWQIIDLVAQLAGVVMFRSEVNILISSNGHVLFRGAREGGAERYLLQALFQLHGDSSQITELSGPNLLPYLQWFVLREGWTVSLLVLVGAVFALRFRLFAWTVPAVLVFVPYVVYIFAPYIVPRNLDAALPFASLLAAAALATIVERVQPYLVQRTVLVLLTGAIAASGALASYRLTGERSGYARAAQYIDRHGGGRALVSNEVLSFYFRGDGRSCDAPRFPHLFRVLTADRERGYRYALLDRYSSPVAGYVRAHAGIVNQFPAYGHISMGENPIASENGTSHPKHRQWFITIYDLSHLRLPPPGRFRSVPCNRDIPA